MIDLFLKSTVFVFKMLTDGLEGCGLLWCVYQLFGLILTHTFTAEDPMVIKSCNATFLQIYSHEQTNSSTSWMAWWFFSIFSFLGELIHLLELKSMQNNQTLNCDSSYTNQDTHTSSCAWQGSHTFRRWTSAGDTPWIHSGGTECASYYDAYRKMTYPSSETQQMYHSRYCL